MKKGNRANVIFTLAIVAACAALWFTPTGLENPAMTKNSLREKALVIETDNQHLENYGVVQTGAQDVKMIVRTGPFKGDTVKGSNVLMGQKRIDKVFVPGDKVLAVLRLDDEGRNITAARADDIYRVELIILLFALFAVFLIGFAKWTGFKALISFVFTAFAFWKILLPLFLKGYNPILVSFGVVILTTGAIIILISGFTRKGAVALLGSVAGVAVTTAMALIFGKLFRIPGAVQEFSETLLYAGFDFLSLSQIFISAIFISAAGAVMDVAMDIAAAQNEIVEKMPSISAKDLIKSGFNVAYPVIGTMTTTLLFAYSGSFTFVFMVFMSRGTPAISIVNTNFIAAEILHTLVGSFGLVLVAPATAIIGGYVYKFTRKEKFATAE